MTIFKQGLSGCPIGGSVYRKHKLQFPPLISVNSVAIKSLIPNELAMSKLSIAFNYFSSMSHKDIFINFNKIEMYSG